uniref:Protein phosphatase 1 regulatory subunit 15A-like n=1 Tax=Neolamprologus brichardi TaxID=32507 RepID=A0A3Q4HIQ3_NEOBR
LPVFQMFRFEVHVRITDETGQHIQHMTTATNPTESFLFTSLFEGDNGVMVGGSNPLSNFCADVGDPFAGKSTAEALLSSLRADDLCCGLVDEFVSRTAGNEEGIFLGHQSGWKMGFPGDWNFFVSSGEDSGSNDTCQKSSEEDLKWDISKEKVFKQDTSEEDRNSHWSSEEDQNTVEFESDESKALWESLSKSSDPYNPFFFSACISTNTDMGKRKSEVKDCSDTNLIESSWSKDEESLWKSLCLKDDPYHPLNFQAPLQSSPKLTLLQDNDSNILDVHHTPNSSTKAKKWAKAPQKPVLPERQTKHHSHPETILVPWKRSGQTPTPTSETKESKDDTTQKKVIIRFSPVVKVHVLRTWPFARQASRKGHWEEMARDRDRFRRRIDKLEQVIGHCFTQTHRENMRAYLDSALKKTKGS